jgi:hypothetical protein
LEAKLKKIGLYTLLSLLAIVLGLASSTRQAPAQTGEQTWLDLAIRFCPQLVDMGAATIREILALKKIKIPLSEDGIDFLSQGGCAVLAYYYGQNQPSESDPVIKPGAKVDQDVLCRYITDIRFRCAAPVPSSPFQGQPRLTARELMRQDAEKANAIKIEQAWIDECKQKSLGPSECLDRGLSLVEPHK